MTFEIIGSRSSVLRQEIQTGPGFWCREDLLRINVELAAQLRGLGNG